MEKISRLRSRVMDAIYASGIPDNIAAEMFAEMGYYIEKFGMHIEDEIPFVTNVKISKPVDAEQYAQSPVSSVSTVVKHENLLEVQRFLENADAVDWLKSAMHQEFVAKGSSCNIIFGKTCVPTSLKWHAVVSSGTCSAFWGDNDVELKPNIPVSLKLSERFGKPSGIGVINKGDDCQLTYWFTRDEVELCRHGTKHRNSVAIRKFFEFLQNYYITNQQIKGSDFDVDLDNFSL